MELDEIEKRLLEVKAEYFSAPEDFFYVVGELYHSIILTMAKNSIEENREIALMVDNIDLIDHNWKEVI